MLPLPAQAFDLVNASLMAGYGYAGILVAFIARQNPLAILPVALLIGVTTAV